MSRLFLLGSLLISCAVWFLYRQYISRTKHRAYRTTSFSYKSRWYLLAGWCFLCASWFIPRGTNLHSGQWQGKDIMIMLDVSQSMLVNDMPNQTNRLDGAKELITFLLEKIPQAQRWIGIFAGEAQSILPLTQDIQLVKTFLVGVDHQNLTQQWTNLAEAINLATERFDTVSTWGNILLIITDGGEDPITIPEHISKKLQEREIFPIFIGIWSEAWWPILEGVDLLWNPIIKQWQGKPVMSKLNEAPLKETAEKINGLYLRWTASITDRVTHEINRIPPKQQTGKTIATPRTLTSLFVVLWVSMLLMSIFAGFLNEMKRSTMKDP